MLLVDCSTAVRCTRCLSTVSAATPGCAGADNGLRKHMASGVQPPVTACTRTPGCGEAGAREVRGNRAPAGDAHDGVQELHLRRQERAHRAQHLLRDRPQPRCVQVPTATVRPSMQLSHQDQDCRLRDYYAVTPQANSGGPLEPWLRRLFGERRSTAPCLLTKPCKIAGAAPAACRQQHVAHGSAIV